MTTICGSGDVNLLVYILVVIFGSGSWIAINGLWVELPLLVHRLPEGWSLPSYLVIVVQLANIGPLVYTLVRKYRRTSSKYYAYVLLVIGVLACLFLAIFWDRTVAITGHEHSLALFVLAFFLSLVDCSSSVVFLPFMSTFGSQYITGYFIGEGLSGLLPSLVALAQGAKDTECVNTTINETHHLVPVPQPPRFGVSIFCIFLCAMMLACGIAYILLNHLPLCKDEHVGQKVVIKDPTLDSYDPYDPTKSETAPLIKSTENRTSVFRRSQRDSPPSKLTMTYVLILVGWLNMMGNGFLPSFQSYASLPYGQQPYHLAVTLRSIMTPVVCFLMFLRPSKSLTMATAAVTLATLWTAVVTYLASQSPEPPMVGTTWGAVIVVLCTILTAALLSSAKVILASVMRDGAPSALVWYGALTQAGSAVGATAAFLIVTTFHLFQSKAPCT